MKKLMMILVIGFAMSLFWGCGVRQRDNYFPLKEGLSHTYSIDGVDCPNDRKF
ncbi:MAG: hypothetical protein U5N56_06525 [Candidatus Marinimicrobia bacterium]|nr:hypothetical protein [Candidatus Neomarinimicrobiota bacterium]